MSEKSSNNEPKDQASDNQVFNELSKGRKLGDWQESSKEEQNKIDRMLSYPDPLPMDFDGNLEAWLLRISNWGKIKITHKNPEDRINRTMNADQFLSYIDNQDRNAAYGLFDVGAPKIDRVRFYRTFGSITGKDVTEEIVVDIDLKPSLKESLKRAKRKNSFLGKLGFFK